MAKTRKCMEMCVEGAQFECIFMFGKTNPYRLYKKTCDGSGTHRKQIAAYGNFVSVIEHIRGIAFATNWGFQDSFGW